MAALTKPCSECPFRKSAPKGWLGEPKATHIATTTLDKNGTFPCHKTVNYKARTEKQMTANSQICAGSILLHEKEGRPNFVYRFLDAKLTGANDIVNSRKDFITLHSND